MSRSNRVTFLALGVTFMIFGLILLAGCGSAQTSNDGPFRSIRGSVQTIVVEGQTRRYVCFTYVGDHRGGLWCERVFPTN